jgi:hypothetical protein
VCGFESIVEVHWGEDRRVERVVVAPDEAASRRLLGEVLVNVKFANMEVMVRTGGRCRRLGGRNLLLGKTRRSLGGVLDRRGGVVALLFRCGVGEDGVDVGDDSVDVGDDSVDVVDDSVEVGDYGVEVRDDVGGDGR